MKRLLSTIMISTILCTSMLFTACQKTPPTPTETAIASETPSESPAPSETAVVSASPDPSAPVVPEQASEEDLIKEHFALTDAENATYEKYIEKNDISVLKDVDPISVAKIFVNCGINDKSAAEYTLYMPGTPNLTLDEYLKYADENRASSPVEQRKKVGDALFGILYKGKFVEVDKTTGYIDFATQMGETAKFNMMKNDDGIWLVNFDMISQ